MNLEGGVFVDNLVVYIKNEIIENFSSDLILNYFGSLKECRLQF